MREEDTNLKLENIDDFLFFRRKAITVLIVNCIQTAKKTLEENAFAGVSDVLSSNKRIIYVEREMKELWDTFYKKWMINYFFEHERVVSCSYKAENIITQLFNAYFGDIRLVPIKIVEERKKQ